MDEILHKKRKMIVDVEELIGAILPAAAVLYQVKEKKERTKSKAWNKLWWTEKYNNCDDSEFKKCFQVSRQTFQYILNIIRQDISSPDVAHQLKPYSNDLRTSTSNYITPIG